MTWKGDNERRGEASVVRTAALPLAPGFGTGAPTPEVLAASEDLGAMRAAAQAEEQTAPAPVAAPSPGKHATLRKALWGEVSHYVGNEQFTVDTVEAITWLVVQLSRYQEEGVVLFPRVLLFKDVHLLKRQMMPGAEIIALGKGTEPQKAMQNALKKCAPLARDEWLVYVQCGPDGAAFEYGVFRETSFPIGWSVRDHMLKTDLTSVGGGILVQQVAERVVELIGTRSHGTPLTYHLTTAGDDEKSPLADVDDLVSAITEDVDPATREWARRFLSAALVDALRKSHGTLIAVARAGAVPAELSRDAGVDLTASPVDLAAIAREHNAAKNIDSLAGAIGHAKLVAGMLATDGITVIHTDAKIVYYNVFVNAPDNGEKKSSAAGGARRRAFEVLTKLVTSGSLVAAFFRSADGGSRFHRK